MTDEILVNNGKATISLDAMGMTQPGMARLMAEVAPRMHRLYYAAQALNWPLARYFWKESHTIFEIATVVRPKYDENMTKFLAEEYAAVGKAIEAKDWAGFDTAFAHMVEHANAYHDLYDKPFLRWKLPDTPPADLDLTPRT